MALLLTVILSFSAVSLLGGCANSKKTPDDEKTLEIYATSAGYGIKWIEELIPIFEDQHPGVQVVLNYDVGVELCRNKVQAGPSANTADLMFSLEDFYSLVLQGDKGVTGYDYALEDLTDFLDEKDENGVSLRDRFLPYYLESGQVELEMENGEFENRDFTLPWATVYTGIVYNKALFEEHSWQLPRTTDELIALAYTIKEAGVTPFVNETSTGYINYMPNCLFAQYIGAEEYFNYYNPITEDDYVYYSMTGSSKGRLYAMYVMDELMNPSNGLLSVTATSDDYGRAQGRLISGEGAMIINGDWFDNEMSLTIQQAKDKGIDYESGMMRIPVISALSDQLSYWKVIMGGVESYQQAYNGSAEGNNLSKCDELLAKLVDYVDGGRSGELPSVEFNGQTVTATAEDADIVEKARNTFYTYGAKHTAVIPSYASAKDLAKDFLRLLYSDTGAEIFLKNTTGGALPIKYDVFSWSGYEDSSSFQKSIYQLLSTGYPAMQTARWRINGGLPEARGIFFKYEKTDPNYISPDTYFQQDSLTKEQFIEIMKNAGLL